MNQSLVELKAKAYDILAQLEYLQKLLSETNQQIAQAQQQPKEEELSPEIVG